jgi:hypothetical protein
MPISQTRNCNKDPMPSFVQKALAEDPETGLPGKLELLLEDPEFLRKIIFSFLGMINGNCVFNSVEVTRLVSLDALEAVEDDSSLLFRVVEDRGVRTYLQSTVQRNLHP